MIRPTEADIGRRVVYAPKVEGVRPARGTVAGFGDRYVAVLFDGHAQPLKVISDLSWIDQAEPSDWFVTAAELAELAS